MENDDQRNTLINILNFLRQIIWRNSNSITIAMPLDAFDLSLVKLAAVKLWAKIYFIIKTYGSLELSHQSTLFFFFTKWIWESISLNQVEIVEVQSLGGLFQKRTYNSSILFVSRLFAISLVLSPNFYIWMSIQIKIKAFFPSTDFTDNRVLTIK